jgi:hypothetical protein
MEVEAATAGHSHHLTSGGQSRVVSWPIPVRKPTFKAEEVERLRQQYLDALSVSLGQPV